MKMKIIFFRTERSQTSKIFSCILSVYKIRFKDTIIFATNWTLIRKLIFETDFKCIIGFQNQFPLPQIGLQ